MAGGSLISEFLRRGILGGRVTSTIPGPSPEPTAPSTPANVTAVAGDTQATISFNVINSGGVNITDCVVTSSPGSLTANGVGSPLTVTGLTNGIEYTFTVTATNSIGTSPASAPSNAVTPSAAAVVPGAPTIGTATPGNATASVAFTAPASDGGSAITSYIVTSSPGGITAVGETSPITVTGLTNGTSYTFTVKAVNAVGTGPASAASAAAIPVTVPGQPGIGAATAGAAQLSVAFTAPASNGGTAITGYTVTVTPTGFSNSGASSPIVVSGLTNGLSYTATVRATNAVGDSVESAPSNAATPITVPDAPTIGAATRGNAQVSVAFSAPSYNGGSAITSYTATSSPGGFTATGSGSPLVVTGLTNGTAYTFTVKANNAAGASAASSASAAVTPATVPDAPTIGAATESSTQASVTFTPPANTGGSAITGYTVTSTPGGLTASGAASPLVVTGLTNGTSYTFTAVATNAVGNSAASGSTAAVIPSTTPGAPTIGTATAGDTTASVAFTAPASDGGAAITEYTATSSPGGLTGTGASSPITVSGLTNGTAYTFTVTATNLRGTGPASAASNSVTPAVLPGPPTDLSAAAGDTQATISFTDPADTGGLAITSYTVTSSPDGLTATGASSPLTVTGLDNGTTYTFTAVATTAVGDSVPSDASNSIIPSGVPGVVDVVSLTPGNGQVMIDFTDADPNGSAVTLYTATSSPGNFTGTSSTSVVTVTGLTNGTPYTFTIVATNVNGDGAASFESAEATPITVPGAPTIGTATAGDTQATVAFTAPASNGGSAIISYTATASPGGATATDTTSPITVAGLQNGVAHTFTVAATNAAGTGAASAASNSVTPTQSVTVPSPPTIGTATASSGQATVTFTPPSNNGGSAITSYTATSTPGGITKVGTSSPLVVTGLTNGTAYRFSVTATNSAGTSPASALSNSVTPLGVPGAPTIGTATAGDTQATVTFTPPASNGGSTITLYTVTSSPSSITGTGTSSPVTVTGLANGTAYTFTVKATNSVGQSAASAASNSVTPTAAGTPGPFDAQYSAGFLAHTAQDTLSVPTQTQPAKSTSITDHGYDDVRFGVRIYRAADAVAFGGGVSKLRHFYSRTQAFNCDGTRYMLLGGSRYFLFNADTHAFILGGKTNSTPAGAIGTNAIYPTGGCEISWHATDPDKIIFAPKDTLSFYTYSCSAKTVTPAFDFVGRLGAVGMGSATKVSTIGEGRPSDNGRYWCWSVFNGTAHLGHICYDMQTDTIVGSLLSTVNVNNCTMSSSGTYCVLAQSYSGTFSQAAASTAVRGIRAYNRTFTSFNQLHSTAGHSDVCIDMDGDDAFIGVASENFEQLPWGMVFYRKCSGGLPVALYQKTDGTTNQMHMSGCNAPGRPGWAIMSTYHETTTGNTNWHDHCVFAIKLGLPLEVRRIAHHRSGAIGLDYWDEPHATVSRDGLRVMWSTRFKETHTGTYQSSVAESYVAGLPSWFYGGSAPSGDPLNVIANGTFSTTAAWTLGAGIETQTGTGGWAISGGRATHTVGTGGNMVQTVSLDPGYYYDVSFDLVSVSAGSVNLRFYSASLGYSQSANFSTVGTHTFSLAYNGHTHFLVNGASTFGGVIDNVKVYKGAALPPSNLIVNGTFATTATWSINNASRMTISGGVLNIVAGDGLAAQCSQPISFEAGATYRVTFNLTRSAGSMGIRFLGGTSVISANQDTTGAKTVDLVANTGNVTFAVHANNTFVGTVDNVTCTKIS